MNTDKINYLMTKEETIEFSKWLNSDNVIFHSNNVYLEQTTQYKKRFTLKEIRLFYINEYMNQ